MRSGTEEKFPSERGTNTIRIPKAAIVGFLSNGRVSAISKRASDIENLSNP